MVNKINDEVTNSLIELNDRIHSKKKKKKGASWEKESKEKEK